LQTPSSTHLSPAAALGPDQHAQNKPFDPIEGELYMLGHQHTGCNVGRCAHACRYPTCWGVLSP
jgi:hypothetical protein